LRASIREDGLWRNVNWDPHLDEGANLGVNGVSHVHIKLSPMSHWQLQLSLPHAK
jgi:hypothetical protein